MGSGTLAARYAAISGLILSQLGAGGIKRVRDVAVLLSQQQQQAVAPHKRDAGHSLIVYDVYDVFIANFAALICSHVRVILRSKP